MRPAEQELRHAYADLFKTRGGRKVLRDLARFAGMTSEPLTAEPDPPASRLFIETGMRRMVLRILAMAEIDELDLVAAAAAPEEEQQRQTRALGPRGENDG